MGRSRNNGLGQLAAEADVDLRDILSIFHALKLLYGF